MKILFENSVHNKLLHISSTSTYFIWEINKYVQELDK
jgi:hypothetical protein